MKSSITRTIAVIFSVVTSSAALADGHYNGQGFSSNISSTTLEGKTGSIIHMINEKLCFSRIWVTGACH